MPDELKKTCGGAPTPPLDFDAGSENVRIEDCDGDSVVSDADRIYVSEDSDGRWFSPKEFQAHLDRRHLIPRGMPLAGKGVAVAQWYADSIVKAGMETIESPRSLWQASERQADVVSYLDMALAYAQEMGLTADAPELRRFGSDFAIRAIETKCAALDRADSVKPTLFLLSALQRMLSGLPTIAALSADDRWLRIVERVRQATRAALRRLPHAVVREHEYGMEATDAAHACAAILNISPPEAAGPVKAAWRATTRVQIAENRDGYLAGGGRNDGWIINILGAFEEADHLGVDLGLDHVRRWAEGEKGNHTSYGIQTRFKGVKEAVREGCVTDGTIANFLYLAKEVGARHPLEERFQELAREVLPALIRHCWGEVDGDIARNYVLQAISDDAAKIGQLYEVAVARGVSSPEIDSLVEGSIASVDGFLSSTIDGGEQEGFYDVLSTLKEKGPALYERMLGSHRERWGKLLFESYGRLIDGASVAHDADNADLARDLYSKAANGIGRARALSIICEPDGGVLQTRMGDIKARLWGAKETGDEDAAVRRGSAERDAGALKELALTYWRVLKSYPDFVAGGINLVYGPVLDVGRADGYMHKAKRLHTADPAVAALLGMLTMAKSTTAAPGTVFVHKHAPGIGALPENPEWEGKIIVDPRSRARIEADFRSFELALAFAPERSAVMIGGAAYPAIEGDGAIRPGMFSPTVMAWVRSRLPESTVLVTDDIGTKTLRKYIHDAHPEIGEDERPFVKQAILDATTAGSDFILYYGRARASVKEVREVALELVAEGKVSRQELEASVKRILNLKRQAYPDHPLLKDVDSTVAKMSVEKLWMQKFVLPAWESNHSRWLATAGAGAIAFEGVRRGPTIQADLHRWVAEHPEELPPFLANNSPQETALRENGANAVRRGEIEAMRAFAEEARRRFPKGLPEEVMRSIVRRVTSPS